MAHHKGVNVFEEVKKYFELGWKVIPYIIKNNDIQPTIKFKPYFYNKELYDKDFKDNWFNGNKYIALICGEVSNIVVLDIDNVSHVFFEQVKELMKDIKTPRAKTNKGYHVFFEYEDCFSKKLQYKEDGINIFDIQSNETLINIPPSLHKNGTFNYKWINDPFTIPIIKMPDNLKELMFSYTNKSLIVKTEKPKRKEHLYTDRLKDIPILDIASRLGLEVDSDNKANCFMPGHKDTHRSLSFNIEKNFFHCFGCEENSGDTIKLVQNNFNCGFLEACNWLNREFFFSIPKEEVKLKESIFVIDDLQELLKYVIKNLKPVDLTREFVMLGGKLTDGKVPQKHKAQLIVQLLLREVYQLGLGLKKVDQGVAINYIYNGSYWLSLNNSQIRDLLSKASYCFGLSSFEAADAFFVDVLLKQFLDASFKSVNADNKIRINLKECVIEFDNGTFKSVPFSPDMFFTYRLSYSYDKESKCPMFHKFLDRTLPDKDDQKTLQEYLGYIFTKNSFLKLEKTLWNFGEGHNGKSVLHDICYGLYGVDNILAFGINDLEQETNRALLADKLLNYASESGRLTDTENFKKLTSGETVNARHLYGKPFQISDYARILFNTNKLPAIVEHNVAFYRRFLLLNWDQRITEEEKDVNLANKIKSKELSGIFNWAIDGLLRLVERKEFTVSEKSKTLLKKYIRETDNVAMFLDTEYMNGLAEVEAKRVYSAYKEFCLEDGYKTLGRNNFYERFIKATEGKYVMYKKTGNILFFKLNDPASLELDKILGGVMDEE